MKKLGGLAGAVMSVDLSETDMGQYPREFGDDLCIACMNSPRDMTISSNEAAIDLLKVKPDVDNMAAQKLNTRLTYHSPHMEEIAADHAECLPSLQTGISSSSRRVTMISSVIGERIQDMKKLCVAKYWVSNMVQPVKYAAAVSQMASASKGTRKLGASKQDIIHDLTEIDPHSALHWPTRTTLSSMTPKNDAGYNFVLSRKRPALEILLDLCGRLWSLSHPIALEKVNQVNKDRVSQSQALVDLPEYPFNPSKRYWHESNMSRHSRRRRYPRHELRGTPVPDWNPL